MAGKSSGKQASSKKDDGKGAADKGKAAAPKAAPHAKAATAKGPGHVAVKTGDHATARSTEKKGQTHRGGDGGQSHQAAKPRPTTPIISAGSGHAGGSLFGGSSLGGGSSGGGSMGGGTRGGLPGGSKPVGLGGFESRPSAKVNPKGGQQGNLRGSPRPTGVTDLSVPRRTAPPGG